MPIRNLRAEVCKIQTVVDTVTGEGSRCTATHRR
jgi:hypothetical protein